MDAGRINKKLITSGVSNGQPKVTKAKTTVVKKQSEKKGVTSTAPGSKNTKSSGILTEFGADGGVRKTADSGMQRENRQDGSVEVKLPTGHVLKSSEKSKSGFQVETDGKTADASPYADGLLAFPDKKTGNTVIVDQQNMKYEVLNKHQNVSQIFEPDGSQTVMAFNTDKSGKETVSEVKFDPQGKRLPNDTFKNLEIKSDGRLSYELNGHKTERTPGLALPGHADPNQKVTSKSVSSGNDMGPMVILEEPPVAAATLNKTAAKTEAPPARQDSIFGGYPDISQDFRAGEKQGFVNVFETESGLMARQENPKGLDTIEGQRDSVWSYKLPNGHTFRTKGKHVETVGKDQGIKNARLVGKEGQPPVLAYSDKDDNRHRLDTGSGDYEVQNKQGSLIQSTAPDGSQKFTVQGTFTTESGKTEQYSKSASFDASGSMVSNNGIDDLAITDKGMAFTLPNGETTTRKLVAPTSVRVEPPVLDDGWGDGPSLADQILGAPVAAGANTSGAPVTKPVAKENSTPANFNDSYAKEGWDVKAKGNPNDFTPRDLDGKEVAFKAKDPKTGQMVEHRGVLKANSDQLRKSALFELEGQKGEFNNNYIDEMAVNKTFDKTFQSEGWDVKAKGNPNDFTPKDLDGKEVAFRQPDPQTGQMVEHRGVLKANSDQHRKSALFELEGQKGEFNNNYIKEMAVNPAAKTTASSSAAPTSGTAAAKPTGQVKTKPPIHSKWGISRAFLPDGGQITQLPNGISVTDGKELFATDKQGNRLEVKKQPYQTPDGKTEHFLSFKNTEGVQYTLSDAHLDMIVVSKDNKVQQTIQEKGSMLIAVNDPITEGPHAGLSHNYLAEFPPAQRVPGFPRLESFDIRHPDRLFAQGSPTGSYELPFPIPLPPGMEKTGPGQGGGNANSGDFRVREKRENKSVRPGMWQKIKNFVTGKPNKTDEAKGGHNEGRGDDIDSVSSGNDYQSRTSDRGRAEGVPHREQHSHVHPDYHGGHHYPGARMQVDPYEREMRNMQRGMAISNTIGTVAVVAGFFMPTGFFFSPFGW